MALSQTYSKNSLMGTEKVLDLHYDLDTSYPTGGYSLPITLPNQGLRIPRLVLVMPQLAYKFIWDYVNNKLIVTDAAGTQIANAVDLSAVKTVRMRVIGN